MRMRAVIRLGLLLVWACPLACQAPLFEPPLERRLVDVFSASGIDPGPPSSALLDKYGYKSVNAAAAGDLDGDRLSDILFFSLTTIPAAYRNLGNFRFEKAFTFGDAIATGAALADVDRDGDLDVLLTTGSAETLEFTIRAYLNDGALHFSEVTTKAGFNARSAPGMLAGMDVTDVNLDGVPDFVPRLRLGVWPVEVWVSQPDGTWREEGSDFFPEVHCNTWASLWTDADLDGLVDVYWLCNGDKGQPPSQFCRRTSRELARFDCHALLFPTGRNDIMGGAAVAVGGEHCAYVTDKGDQHLVVRELDVARDRGVIANPTPDGREVGYAAAFEDLDLDGHPDLVVTGSVGFDGWTDPPRLQVYRGSDRGWSDAAEEWLGAEDHVASEQALAVADFDGDGRPDLFLGGYGAPPRLLRNGISGGHPLAVRLRGRQSTTAGLGARVSVVGVSRDVSPTGSPWGQSDAVLHFGLGQAREADVEVTWPSGAKSTVRARSGDLVEVEEPE